MAVLWLLCEGGSDVPILESVLTTVLSADIIPKPVGGGSNAASAAQYVASNNKDVTAAYVIDRDYQQKSVAETMLIDGKRGFMWRRHAIESYLLEPVVIVTAFKNLKASVVNNPNPAPAWMKGLPEDPLTVAEGLRACAKIRAPQEAARMALQRLWEDLSETAGRFQKRTPKVLSQGSPDAALCLQALLDEATRLVAKSKEAVSSPHLEPPSITQRYDAEFAKVSGTDYLNKLLFIEEFHGKDLLNAFHAWLEQECKAPLWRNRFVLELEKAVPLAYRANRLLYGTDDFLELANGIRALAALSPVKHPLT